MSDLSMLYDVVNSCRPDQALAADDPRYIDLSAARTGPHSPGKRLVRRIDQTPSESFEHQLFTGHRGSGKTTELGQVKAALEARDYKVLLFGVSNSLDLLDVSFPDLMLAIGKETTDQMEAEGIEIDKKALKSISQWFASVEQVNQDFRESELHLKTEVSAKASIPMLAKVLARLTGSIKGKSTHKRVIRRMLNEKPGDLVGYINQLIDGYQRVLIEKMGKRGLVIIIDQLDRIHRREYESGSNAHNHLYIDYGDLLCQLRCHVIYTMPISLTLEANARRLTSIFNFAPLVLPMVRIKNEDGRINEKGYQAFRDLMEKRFATHDVFVTDAVDLLIQMSGGHPRYLMQLIQTTCEFAEVLPITLDVARAACRDRRNNEFARTIPDTYWPELVRIHREKTLQKGESSSELLFFQYVLEYVNGEPWYDVHPLISSLKAFRNEWRERELPPIVDPLE